MANSGSTCSPRSGHICATAVPAVRPCISQKRIQLTVDLPAEKRNIRANPVRIHGADTNYLVVNALKIHSGRVPSRNQVPIARYRRVITVKDSGRGIEAEELGKIFQPLKQLDRTGHMTRAGAGMGLASRSPEPWPKRTGRMTAVTRAGVTHDPYARVPTTPPQCSLPIDPPFPHRKSEKKRRLLWTIDHPDTLRIPLRILRTRRLHR
jgi:hypothetical protein